VTDFSLHGLRLSDGTIYADDGTICVELRSSGEGAFFPESVYMLEERFKEEKTKYKKLTEKQIFKLPEDIQDKLFSTFEHVYSTLSSVGINLI
jgi:hypothetical protein